MPGQMISCVFEQNHLDFVACLISPNCNR